MTTMSDTKLGDLLLPGVSALAARLATSLETSEEAAEIKGALAKAVPGLPLGPIIDGVSKGLETALDVPISSMLAGAWDRARELRAAMQQTRDSEKDAVLLPLLDHTITSEHRPYVDVVLNGTAIARLVFPLTVIFHLEGIVLRIAKGRIADVLAGQVTIKATLKFAEFVLIEKALPPMTIPGALALVHAEAA
jgi:hypothetical protein